MTVKDKIQRNHFLDRVRAMLPVVKEASSTVSKSKTEYEEASAATLKDMLQIVEPNGERIRFEYDGQELSAGVVQGKKSGNWDLARLVEHLKERGLWNKVSARMLDQNLLDSLIARGEIDGETLKKEFWVEGGLNSPYIKFGNADSESL